VIADVLRDIVVLDFGQLIAGPVCGMWLADMGATVVKVEPPGGELGRRLGPPWLGGESLTMLTSNCNKLGLSIDLKHPAATEVVARMAKQADVLVENFRPGVMHRLGLDYDTLRRLSPKIVYCSISAYGATTPWRARPGVDGILQAATGLMSGIAAGGGEPGKVPLPLADMTAAMFGTMAILAALRKRDREGAGSHLDLSLYDGMLMLQQLNVASFLANREEPEPQGSAAPYAAPNEALQTADGWIMVAAYQPKRWKALCTAIGRVDLLDDTRFATNEARVANRPAMRDALTAALRTRPTAYWFAMLTAADVIAAPVADYADVVASDQYAVSGIEVAVDRPGAGQFHMPGFAVGGRPVPPRRPPPREGQHSWHVLERFGFGNDEIERLINDHVVGTEVTA
jgi:crotonobetainyl-CoA:carnitine CoA-transferase CaiB-like acyl-CoA transferase